MYDLPTDIPSDLSTFYNDVGCPGYFNGKNAELAPYEYTIWKDYMKYEDRVYLHGPGVDLSRSFMLESIHAALTGCRGREVLVVTTTEELSKQYLQYIRDIIKKSRYYEYLMGHLIPGEMDYLLPEYVEAEWRIGLRNPGEPKHPTEILKGYTSGFGSYLGGNTGRIQAIDIADSMSGHDMGNYSTLYTRIVDRGSRVYDCPSHDVWRPIAENILKSNSPDARGMDFGAGKKTENGWFVRSINA